MRGRAEQEEGGVRHTCQSARCRACYRSQCSGGLGANSSQQQEGCSSLRRLLLLLRSASCPSSAGPGSSPDTVLRVLAPD